MTNEEFSTQFDVLYNNITSNQAPGLNEYEKSVFLTKAQDEIVKSYFSPETNPQGKGFDNTQRRQVDFSMLMVTVEQNPTTVTSYTQFDPRSLLYYMPQDIFFIVNEQLVLQHMDASIQATNKTKLVGIRQVIPISYLDYTRMMSKPYKEPLKYQAWRIITGINAQNNDSNAENLNTSFIAEIICRTSDRNLTYIGPVGRGGAPTEEEVPKIYKIRYVKRPTPIVLETFEEILGEDLSINGINTKTECQLDPILHQEILERAVTLAKIAWQGGTASIANAQSQRQRGE